MRTADPRTVLRSLFAACTLALSLTGCPTNGVIVADDDTADPCDAEVTVSPVVGTVVTVRWTPGVDEVDDAWVEYGVPGTLDRTAPAQETDDGQFEAVVLGLRASTDYALRTAVTAGGETTTCDVGTVTTGPLPASMPGFAWHAAGAGDITPGYMLTSLVATPPMPVILDTEGHVVWWYEFDEGHPSAMSRLIPSVDGRSFILQEPSGGDQFEDPGDVLRVSYDGMGTEVIAGAESGHHDMAELPDGTLAIIEEDWRDVEGEQVAADRIVEVQPDGSLVEIWNAWDHEAYTGVADEGFSFTHANAIDHVEAEDAYHVSLRNLHTIYKIDRASGDVLWKLGGEDSSFTLPGGDTGFSYYQHQFQPMGDEILIFDNGDPAVYDSRVVHYRLDPFTDEAELLWEHHSDPPLYNYGLGDVTRLDSGNTLVTWSVFGRLEEVNPGGEPVWRINVDEIGAGIAYTTFLESLYVTPPPY